MDLIKKGRLEISKLDRCIIRGTIMILELIPLLIGLSVGISLMGVYSVYQGFRDRQPSLLSEAEICAFRYCVKGPGGALNRKCIPDVRPLRVCFLALGNCTVRVCFYQNAL